MSGDQPAPSWPDEWPVVNGSAPDEQARNDEIFTAKISDVAAERKAVRDRYATEESATLARDLDSEKVEEAAFVAQAAKNREADLSNLAKFHESMYTLASTSVDRARSGAELVQKAAAAIATLYTGALALAFSVTDNPLPARGILAPAFLGAAVALSTAYAAYLKQTRNPPLTPEVASGVEPKSVARLNLFIDSTSRLVTERSWLLRASIFALGVGLLFIALPFLQVGGSAGGFNAPTGAEAQDWPHIPPGTLNDAEVELYKAQIDEVVELRKNATKSDAANDLIVFWAGLAAGAVVTVGGTLATSTRSRQT